MGISFKEVSHYYKGIKKNDITIALENINLNIDKENEFISIIGKTGSGKSTLVQHMNALKLPSKGAIDIFDYTITPNPRKNPKLKEIRRRVGFVFQFPEYQLFEETVLKDIMFAPKNFGSSEALAKEKAMKVAKLLEIEDLLDKSPFNLSGGQMRRCAIAGILAYEPDILVLDEPTRGLDPKGAKEIMELFYKIHKDLNKTIILITHDMDIMYQYSTRAIVLSDGHIVYDGDPLRLFDSHIYKKYSLSRPKVLELIDYLNEKMGYFIDYNTHNLDDVIMKVVKSNG